MNEIKQLTLSMHLKNFFSRKVENKTGKPFAGKNGEMVEPELKSEITGVKKTDEQVAEPVFVDPEKIPF